MASSAWGSIEPDTALDSEPDYPIHEDLPFVPSASTNIEKLAWGETKYPEELSLSLLEFTKAVGSIAPRLLVSGMDSSMELACLGHPDDITFPAIYDRILAGTYNNNLKRYLFDIRLPFIKYLATHRGPAFEQLRSQIRFVLDGITEQIGKLTPFDGMHTCRDLLDSILSIDNDCASWFLFHSDDHDWKMEFSENRDRVSTTIYDVFVRLEMYKYPTCDAFAKDLEQIGETYWEETKNDPDAMNNPYRTFARMLIVRAQHFMSSQSALYKDANDLPHIVTALAAKRASPSDLPQISQYGRGKYVHELAESDAWAISNVVREESPVWNILPLPTQDNNYSRYISVLAASFREWVDDIPYLTQQNGYIGLKGAKNFDDVAKWKNGETAKKAQTTIKQELFNLRRRSILDAAASILGRESATDKQVEIDLSLPIPAPLLRAIETCWGVYAEIQSEHSVRRLNESKKNLYRAAHKTGDAPNKFAVSPFEYELISQLTNKKFLTFWSSIPTMTIVDAYLRFNKDEEPQHVLDILNKKIFVFPSTSEDVSGYTLREKQRDVVKHILSCICLFFQFAVEIDKDSDEDKDRGMKHILEKLDEIYGGSKFSRPSGGEEMDLGGVDVNAAQDFFFLCEVRFLAPDTDHQFLLNGRVLSYSFSEMQISLARNLFSAFTVWVKPIIKTEMDDKASLHRIMSMINDQDNPGNNFDWGDDGHVMSVDQLYDNVSAKMDISASIAGVTSDNKSAQPKSQPRDLTPKTLMSVVSTSPMPLKQPNWIAECVASGDWQMLASSGKRVIHYYNLINNEDITELMMNETVMRHAIESMHAEALAEEIEREEKELVKLSIREILDSGVVTDDQAKMEIERADLEGEIRELEKSLMRKPKKKSKAGSGNADTQTDESEMKTMLQKKRMRLKELDAEMNKLNKQAFGESTGGKRRTTTGQAPKRVKQSPSQNPPAKKKLSSRQEGEERDRKLKEALG